MGVLMTTLTQEQITEWLNDDNAIRGTLIEVQVLPNGSSTEITRYLSTFGFTTSPTDTPSNTTYDSLLAGGIRFTERLDIMGSGSLSVGDIEIINTTGELDSWIHDTWANRRIKAFVGDVTWSRDKFFQVFDGIVVDIDSRNPNSLSLKLRDKMQALNTPISELNYSDIYPYPNSANLSPHYDPTDVNNTVPDLAIPMAFGEIHNATPVLIDPGNLVYIVNYGPINGIIEVRDNGIPLTYPTAYSIDAAKGTIKMNYQPMGVLTVSFQGDSAVGYKDTCASLIKRLVTGFGKVVPNPTTGTPTTRTGPVVPGSSPPIGAPVITPSPERFVDGVDIDSSNFANFESANTQPMGVYVPSKENLLTTIQNLARSVGGALSPGRDGKLRLLKLESPPTGVPFIIEDHMYKLESLQITNRTLVIGAIKLGYNKNWTVEQNLLTNIPPEHRKLFAEDISTIGVFNADTLSKYKLTSLPALEETYLITQQAASVEANRRLDLWSQPHTIYKIIGFSPLFDLKIGDTVQLTNWRYGLETGKLGTVVSLQPNWTTATVEVEIFI